MKSSIIMNRHFRVKVYGRNINTLVGWSGLVNLVGYSAAKSLVWAAYNAGMDKWSFCRFKGLKIHFYAK